jgi:DNA-binding NarL/FixJ family response regulator
MSERLKVIVADDSAGFRSRMRIALRELPEILLVGEAANGHEALALARGLRPDVLILDMKMRGMSGLAVADKLRKEKNPTVVVMLTIQPEFIYRERILGGDADYFLNKITEIDLLETLLPELAKLHRKREHSFVP